jgi:O-antigen/teichoic acid export membrane protein
MVACFEEAMNLEVHSKIKSGLKWSLLNQVISQVIFLCFGIYLARLLGPAAYGLVGMVTVFSGFAVIFVDFGFTSAVIYFQELSQKSLSSIFWFNLVLGTLIYVLFYISSPLISQFYHEPQLIALTRVVTLSVVINSLSALQNALLSKNIDFKMKTITSWISIILSYGIAFTLAFFDFGVWSLVIQTLSISILNTIFIWYLAKWRPDIHFSFADIKPLLKYGSGIAGTSIFGYLTRNLDNLIIGKFLGNASLGIYTRSYSLMMLPITNISTVFSKVLFPAFATMQNDLNRFATYYNKVIKHIAFLTFPMMFGLSSVSREFVLIFLGNKWVDAIVIIKILSILGAFQSILSLNGTIYNSTGNSVKALKVTMILNLFLVPSWIIGLYLGNLNGLVWAYFLVGTLGALPIWAYALKQINLKMFDVVNKLKVIFFASLFLFICNECISLLKLELVVSFIVKIFTGILSYSVVIFLFDKIYYEEIMIRIASLSKRR